MIIYFYSNKPRAGKSLILSAFSNLLTKKNIKNIAIKPIFDPSSKDDSETQSNFNELLAQNTQFQSQSASIKQTKNDLKEFVSEIQNLNKKYKVVLVEVASNASIDFNSELPDSNSIHILINEFATTANIKHINSYKNLDWIIYNKVPKYRSNYIQSTIIPKLKLESKKVIASIPESRLLNSNSINEINLFLNGTYIVEENTENIIESFLIGTPTMDSGKHYYNYHKNPAVIVRSDRPDIQMSALYQDVKCLILAGKSKIADYVIYEAEVREIPLIQVDSNTIDTANQINLISKITNPFHRHKMEAITKTLNDQINLDTILSI
jgi:BioD-like phosphotransacetylase family protein